MIEFPKGYFEDEVRDGFFVSSVMKKCWAAQMEVLSDIAYVCDKYNIRWFADCGTLLGAVRHGGFVPWDDDLDICMFRDDYYRFLTVASSELKRIWPQYQILNYHNEQYWEPISRIVNSDEVEFKEERLAKFHGYPLCAGIDVFPLDFVCPDPEEEQARKNLFKTIFELADSDFAETIDRESLNMLAETVGRKVDNSKSVKLQLYEWGEVVSSLYGRDEAKDVCLMTFWYRYDNHKYPIELFDKTVVLPFENIYINAPAGYDQVLKIEYGDYMRQVRTGGIHEYPHYEGQIETVGDWLGEASPFCKHISKESIDNIIETEANDKSVREVKEKALEFVSLLTEAHNEIDKMLNNKNLQVAVQLLCQCQDLAIRVGTMIEEACGEGFVTVKYLEEYCEGVYKVFEKLNKTGCVERGEAGECEFEEFSEQVKAALELMNEVVEQLTVIEKSIKEDVGEIQEIVFIPFRADYWNAMEGMWREVKDDPKVNAVVMPIPYYEKNALGEKVAMYYDIESYPDYLPLVSFEEYDIEKRRPSKIIIQYTYDGDNFVTGIDSRFYAENLRKVTDELVYVPYFVTEEIAPGEERSYKMMDNYVISPAVVYSNKVVVQSDNIRELYIKKLKEYFGEQLYDIWEKKINTSNIPVYAYPKVSKENIAMPDDWRGKIFKADGTAKRVIIYCTSISGLFEHRYRMIEKMRSVFKVFAGNRDVVMLWCPDPLVDATIPTTDPKLYENYLNLKGEFEDKSMGILDDSGNNDRLMLMADAYYGDNGRLIQLCRNRNIPVMIQNVEVM